MPDTALFGVSKPEFRHPCANLPSLAREAVMLTWSDQFLIGHERIDLEHKLFFGLIQDFQKARSLNESSEQLANILNEIVLFARFHFSSEENIMERMAYPALMEHRDQHHMLIEHLCNEVMGFGMGIYTADEVDEFLVDWFINHLQSSDNRLVEYRNQQPV